MSAVDLTTEMNTDVRENYEAVLDFIQLIGQLNSILKFAKTVKPEIAQDILFESPIAISDKSIHTEVQRLLARQPKEHSLCPTILLKLACSGTDYRCLIDRCVQAVMANMKRQIAVDFEREIFHYQRSYLQNTISIYNEFVKSQIPASVDARCEDPSAMLAYQIIDEMLFPGASLNKHRHNERHVKIIVDLGETEQARTQILDHVLAKLRTFATQLKLAGDHHRPHLLFDHIYDLETSYFLVDIIKQLLHKNIQPSDNTSHQSRWRAVEQIDRTENNLTQNNTKAYMGKNEIAWQQCLNEIRCDISTDDFPLLNHIIEECITTFQATTFM